MRGESNWKFYVMFRRGKGSRECWQQNSDKAKDISLRTIVTSLFPDRSSLLAKGKCKVHAVSNKQY